MPPMVCARTSGRILSDRRQRRDSPERREEEESCARSTPTREIHGHRAQVLEQAQQAVNWRAVTREYGRQGWTGCNPHSGIQSPLATAGVREKMKTLGRGREPGSLGG